MSCSYVHILIRARDRNKNIIWTVEWVHPDGHRDLGKCPETQSISEAYAAFLKHLENNRPSKRRKMHTGRQGHPSTAKVASTSGPPGSPLRHNCSTKIPKTEPSISATTVKQELENPAWSKRKELDMLRQKVQESRTSAAKLNHDGQVREAAERTDGTQPQTVKPDIFSPTHVNAAEPSVDHAGPIAREAQQIPEKVISLNEPNSSEEAEQEALSKNDQGERGERESIEEKVVLDQAQTSASTAAPPNPSPIVAHPEPTESLAFYLHHPSLPSRNPVLIPFSPDANLATSLSSRLVLEFPTIFALHLQPDGKLPDGFISEDDFFAKTKKGLIEEVAEGDLIGESIGSVGVVGEGLEDGEVDEGRLLEVLGKDLKGIAGSL